MNVFDDLSGGMNTIQNVAGSVGEVLSGITGKTLGKASFRGISFFVIGSQSTSGGRRLVVQEYPYRTLHGVDDLGPKAGSISVRALFLSDQYVAQYARFKEVLEEDGPGELVHPYLESGLYYVDDFNGDIDVAVRRAAYFDLVLIPAGEETGPAAENNTVTDLTSSINDTMNTLIDNFTEAWDFVGEIGATIDAVNTTIDHISYGINMVTSGINDGFGLVSSIANIRNSVNQLVQKPRELARALTGAIVGIGQATTPNHATAIYGQMLGRNQVDTSNKITTHNESLTDVNGTVNMALTGSTPNSLTPQTRANIQSLNYLVEGVTLAAQVSAIASSVTDELQSTRLQSVKPRFPVLTNFIQPWDRVNGDDLTVAFNVESRPPIQTKQDAYAVIERTGDRIESLAFSLSMSDWDFLNVMNLRHQFLIDTNKRTENLVGTITVIPDETKPSLSLLHEIKQDASLNDGFVTRNELRNPLFCQALTPFEVLEK